MLKRKDGVVVPQNYDSLNNIRMHRELLNRIDKLENRVRVLEQQKGVNIADG